MELSLYSKERSVFSAKLSTTNGSADRLADSILIAETIERNSRATSKGFTWLSTRGSDIVR